MRSITSSVILASLLLTACGGSSSGSGDEMRNLDRHGSDVQRESRTPQNATEEAGHQPTFDFYHFTEQQAVLVVEFPNRSPNFGMEASVAIFDRTETPDSIRRWINNQTSTALDPRAARPSEVINLEKGEHFHTLDSLYSDSVSRPSGALYERYQLEYEFLGAEQSGRFQLRPFTAFATTYLWVNNFADIVNVPLPIVETFDADNAAEFFSPDYKALRTRYARFAPSLDDELPAFYYPLCCYNDVGNSGRADIDEGHLSIENNSLRIRDAQFTIGQTQHLYRTSNNPNPKIDSILYHHTNSNMTSWGEMDLSEPYRVSFCVKDASANGQLGLWADNNAGEELFNKPFSHASRLTLLDTNLLIPGERLTVNVPGDILIGNDIVSTVNNAIGTQKSFLQVRVDQGGDVTISDLVIESQNEGNAAGMSCEGVSD